MASISLDLAHTDDLHVLQADGGRIAPGLVPGEPNEGLVAARRGRPARRADCDDAGGGVSAIQERRSVGCPCAWDRLRLTMPVTVKGQAVAGTRVCVACTVENDGDGWVDGVMDRAIGTVTGPNTPKRVPGHPSAVPGTQHVLAVLVANAPLGDPVGTLFVRSVTLACEAPAGSPASREGTPDDRCA